MGGISAERAVSLESGTGILNALKELGHEAYELDVTPSLPGELLSLAPDAVFIALHGRGGEDGSIQGMLEILRIPYTGSGVLSSAVCLDKVTSKEVLSRHNIPVAKDIVAYRGGEIDATVRQVEESLGFPVMIKPASEGSSIGLAKARDREELICSLELAFRYDDRVLVETFINGRQFTVGIIGKRLRVLPVLEIRTTTEFYNYCAKYEPGHTEYIVPAPIPATLASLAQRISLDCHRLLRCSGLSRVDLMLDEASGELLVLEVNTIPGMTSRSLLPKAASAIGLSFSDVVAEILDAASLKIELTEEGA